MSEKTVVFTREENTEKTWTQLCEKMRHDPKTANAIVANVSGSWALSCREVKKQQVGKILSFTQEA